MSNTEKLIESRIEWTFEKANVEKTAESTIYTLTMRGQVYDILQHTYSDMQYQSHRTAIPDDFVRAVAGIVITRYNKGGAKMKDHVKVDILPAVSRIANYGGQVYFPTQEETDEAINAAVQSLVNAIAAPDNFSEFPRLTDAGKGALNSFARKKGKVNLDIERIHTKIADRPQRD